MSAQAARGNGEDRAASTRAGASLDAAEFAEYLRAERERRRLTLDQVAVATRIAPHHLAALERGDVRHWPGGMYRRAMMRAYAESIGVDRELALKQFERAFESPAARQESPAAAPQPPRPAARRADPPVHAVRRLRPGAVLVGVAAVVGVAIGAGLWSLASPGDTTPSPDTRTALAAGAASDAAPEAAPPAVRRSAVSAPVPRSTTPAAAAPRRSDAGSAPAPASARPAASEGRLIVTSEPAGARVTVNGIGWGETPLTIRHLPPGDKRVRLTLQGYVSQERVVRLGPPSPDARLRLTLRKRTATSAPR